MKDCLATLALLSVLALPAPPAGAQASRSACPPVVLAQLGTIECPKRCPRGQICKCKQNFPGDPMVCYCALPDIKIPDRKK